MKRNGVALGLGLVLVAAVSALLVGYVIWDRGDSERPVETEEIQPLAATGALSPRIALFGDTITARVDVVIDREVVDPEHVTVVWSPSPWTQVRAPQREVRIAGQTAYLSTSYALRCLTSPCVPIRETEQFQLRPARVTYEAPVEETPSRLSVDVAWPVLVVHTRITNADVSQRDALAAPWRADFVSLPLVSYRAAPGLVLGLVLALAAILIAVAALVTYRIWPRREPPPEPEPPPRPVATLLEQALALLEAPAAANGAADRRRALELVADEVERWGDAGLAQTARALAWSEHAPEGEATHVFAARLRQRMEDFDGASA